MSNDCIPISWKSHWTESQGFYISQHQIYIKNKVNRMVERSFWQPWHPKLVRIWVAKKEKLTKWATIPQSVWFSRRTVVGIETNISLSLSSIGDLFAETGQSDKQTKPQNDEPYRPPLPEGSKNHCWSLLEEEKLQLTEMDSNYRNH